MANHHTVDILPGGNGQLGGVSELSRSNTASLSASFPNTPDWIVDGDDNTRRTNLESAFESDVLNATITNGYLFSSVSMNYEQAPVISSVAFGPGGLPGNPWQPNTASPAAGVNPLTMPAPPSYVADASKTSRPPFIGEGTDLDPSASSARYAESKVNDLTLGQSLSRSENWGSYNNSGDAV